MYIYIYIYTYTHAHWPACIIEAQRNCGLHASNKCFPHTMRGFTHLAHAHTHTHTYTQIIYQTTSPIWQEQADMRMAIQHGTHKLRTLKGDKAKLLLSAHSVSTTGQERYLGEAVVDVAKSQRLDIWVPLEVGALSCCVRLSCALRVRGWFACVGLCVRTLHVNVYTRVVHVHGIHGCVDLWFSPQVVIYVRIVPRT